MYDNPVLSYCTYLLTTVFPGTGKSSIVCAMCLGLAGQAKLLGRATEVRMNCSTIHFKVCSPLKPQPKGSQHAKATCHNIGRNMLHGFGHPVAIYCDMYVGCCWLKF